MTYIISALVILFVLYVGGFTIYREFIIEKPTYEVISKSEGYEIRNYEPYITASYTATGESINNGFMQVAGYIFGDNQTTQSISMTSPVLDTPASEPIAMTSPVIDTPLGTERRTSFVLPSNYSLEDLPTPNNKQVEITSVPETQWAVMRFSAGPYRSEALEEKRLQLLQYLERDSIAYTQEYQFAFYDPPGLIWPFRRDEVWIKLSQEEN